MTSPYLAFDGKSLKTAPSFASAIQDKFYGGDAANAAVVAGLDAQKAYKLVPWLYRAVTLRAYHVSRFPFALLTEQGKDVTTDPAYASLLATWRTRLWLTEASKVVTGAAYWAIEANAYGRNITPRYLPSQSVQPRYDTTVGLTHFYFSGNYHAELAREIPLDRMVWFWEPNISDEVSPGPAPAAVALAAASMLYALDAFTANFFNRGGVKVTVFEIPPSTSDADKNAFTTFLQRSVAGVRNAFKMIPVRGGVKPTVIGSDVKDTQAPELTDLQRDNVAAAIGVPASVIDGRSSDDSNSRSEKLAFVTDTIIPEVEMLFETANEKLFKQFKLKLVAQPEKLEIMQAQQLDQVTAVTEAVGKPVLLEHEGRALLGYPPVEQAEKAYDEQLAALGLTRAGGEKYPCASCGATSPNDSRGNCAACGAPRTKPAGEDAPQADMTAMEPVTDAAEPDDDEAEQVKKALGEWRKTVLDNLKAGGPQTMLPDLGSIPKRLRDRLFADLATAKTPAAVRAVFARHWPKSAAKAEPTLAEVMAELRAARLAAEKVAA